MTTTFSRTRGLREDDLSALRAMIVRRDNLKAGRGLLSNLRSRVSYRRRGGLNI